MLHRGVCLGLCIVAGCGSGSGWFDDASVQRSLVQLQRIDAAMASSDGRAGAFAAMSFGGALHDILTPDGPSEVHEGGELPVYATYTANLLRCAPGACTLEYAGFLDVYSSSGIYAHVKRTGDTLELDFADYSGYRKSFSSSGGYSGVLTVSATEVNGTIRTNGSFRRQEPTVDAPQIMKSDGYVTFDHVPLVPDGCAGAGRVTAHAWREEDGDTVYDLDTSEDVGASCN